MLVFLVLVGICLTIVHLFLQRLAEIQAQAIQNRTRMPTNYDLEMELHAACTKQVSFAAGIHDIT